MKAHGTQATWAKMEAILPPLTVSASLSHFHFAPVCLQVALVLSLPPARWVKDFGSHPCVSPIPSLLVSSPVLHSGWAGMEDFGSCVFVALTTVSSS